jgi:hypothetical protein
MIDFCIFNHLFFKQNVFHFEEWLVHHLDMGIKNFVLYEGSHNEIPCLNKDVKRGIKINNESFSNTDTYNHYNKIKEKYSRSRNIKFIKWLPINSNGRFIPHNSFNLREQELSFRHFYEKFANNYDWVICLDCDEFLHFNNKFSNLLEDSFLLSWLISSKTHKALYLQSKIFESVHINPFSMVRKKDKCLDKVIYKGGKYIRRGERISQKSKISPHYPPVCKSHEIVNSSYYDLGFNHYKLNERSKEAVEHYNQIKTKVVKDSSMMHFVKSHYDFFKVKNELEDKDIEVDTLGLDLFDWDDIIYKEVQNDS